MNDDTLKQAISEAKRFITKAKTVDDIWQWDSTGGKSVKGRSGKTNAAIKRASMDLTRVLANLRSGK